MALRQGLRSLGSRLVQGQQFAPLQSIAAHLPFSLQNDDGSALPGPVSSTMGSRRWYASDVAVPTTFSRSGIVPTASGMLPTTYAIKNPTPDIEYDEHSHEQFVPGDPSKRAFTYFVLTGGRFIYASALRLAVLKFILSMTATKDVLAMASLEVDLSKIDMGSTITVKWRGKPVFVRRRSPEDIQGAESVDLKALRDPQTDAERVINPEWLVVVGVCTHLGCVPLPGAGDYNGWFCPCHGSHYDTSGRIRKGPAPYNLEVPEYKFMDDTTLLVG